MTAQVAIEPEQTFGLELEEYGIDELHYIVTSHTWQQSVESGHQTDAAKHARLACNVDVAGVVLPEVTVGNHGDTMPQLAQTFGQRGVYIAIFAYQ